MKVFLVSAAAFCLVFVITNGIPLAEPPTALADEDLTRTGSWPVAKALAPAVVPPVSPPATTPAPSTGGCGGALGGFQYIFPFPFFPVAPGKPLNFYKTNKREFKLK